MDSLLFLAHGLKIPKKNKKNTLSQAEFPQNDHKSFWTKCEKYC